MSERKRIALYYNEAASTIETVTGNYIATWSFTDDQLEVLEDPAPSEPELEPADPAPPASVDIVKLAAIYSADDLVKLRAVGLL